MTPTTRFATVSVVALAAAFALTGCVLVPVGPAASEAHNVGDDVHGIRIESNVDVDVLLGDEPGLTITAPKTVLDRITVAERDGMLVLGSTGPDFAVREVSAVLTVTALDSIEIEGAGDVDADLSAAREVSIVVDGAGDVEAEGIDASSVEVEISGAGNVDLEGVAESARYKIGGAGDIDAESLRVVDAVAEVEGAGSITLYATGTADATIGGIGDITVHGGAEVTRTQDGVGSIREE